MENMFQSNILIALVVILADLANGRLVPKLSNIVCTSFDRSFCEFEKCELKAIKPDVTELSLYVKMKQTPVNNVSATIILRKSGHNRGKPIIEITFDACAFLRSKNRNPIATMFYKLMGLDTHSNMNHTCPYNHDLILDRYRFDEKYMYFGAILEGHYTFSALWRSDKIPRATVNISVQVLESF